MKISCAYCQSDFEGNIPRDEFGWRSKCPKCGCSIKVNVPKGKIVMAFVDDSDDSKDWEHFTDDFRGVDIRTYYAFDDVEEFMKAWYKMQETEPDGMWYWVMDDGKLITSGACDPDDDESFAEHFGFSVEEMWNKYHDPKTGKCSWTTEEYTELCTFPDDDKDYCKSFKVQTAWLMEILESMDSFNNREGVDLEQFLDNYVWDETWAIYESAKAAGKLLSEEEVA